MHNHPSVQAPVMLAYTTVREIGSIDNAGSGCCDALTGHHLQLPAHDLPSLLTM